MKLNSHDRLVLGSLFLNCDRNIQDVCQETGLRDHTVRRVLNRLFERNVISKCYLINVYRIGFIQYGAFLTVGGTKSLQYESLLRFIEKFPAVSFLVEFSGRFSLGLSVCDRSLVEIRGLLDELSLKFGNIFHDRALAVRVGLTHFSAKYLHSRVDLKGNLFWGAGDSIEEYDDLDHQILVSLSRQPNINLSARATSLRIPISTLHYRIESLKQRGILVGSILIINTEAVGLISATLLVYTRGLHAPIRSQLHEYCQNHPNVYFLVENLGDWDYEIGVHASGMNEIGQMVRALYERFSDSIRAIDTLTSLSVKKVQNYARGAR